MDSLKKIKAQTVHLTLTLADVDALHKAGVLALHENIDLLDKIDLSNALQKLDEAVNL